MRTPPSVVQIGLIVLAGCGHRSAGPAVRDLGVIDTTAGTPVWMGSAGGKLLVATTHGDVGQATTALISIDPTSGHQVQLAGALPTGSLTLHAGTMYLAGATGEVGIVDLTSGAYNKLFSVDGTARALAVTDAGVVVGTTGHLELYDRTGGHHTVAGSELIGPGDFDALAETRAGVFAASSVGGKVFKVDGDRATVVADHQVAPTSLVATDSHIVWTVGDNGNVGQHVVAIPLAGGPQIRLADAIAPAQILGVGADKTHVACAMAGGGSGEVVTVIPGASPRRLAVAPARLVVLDAGTVYWIEDAAKGWTVRAIAGG